MSIDFLGLLGVIGDEAEVDLGENAYFRDDGHHKVSEFYRLGYFFFRGDWRHGVCKLNRLSYFFQDSLVVAFTDIEHHHIGMGLLGKAQAEQGILLQGIENRWPHA